MHLFKTYIVQFSNISIKVNLKIVRLKCNLAYFAFPTRNVNLTQTLDANPEISFLFETEISKNASEQNSTNFHESLSSLLSSGSYFVTYLVTKIG